jgi:hypothetical protein
VKGDTPLHADRSTQLGLADAGYEYREEDVVVGVLR